MPFVDPPPIVRTVDDETRGVARFQVAQGAEAQAAGAAISKLIGVASLTLQRLPSFQRTVTQYIDLTKRELERRNSEQEGYYPLGVRAGEFQFKDEVLAYRVKGAHGLAEIVCKVVSCPDPELLDPVLVRRLAQANQGDQAVSQALSDFAARLERGVKTSSETLPDNTLLLCLPGDAAGIQAPHLVIAHKLATESAGAVDSKLQDQLMATGLLKEALHQRHRAEVDLMNLPYEASLGRRTFAVSSAEDVRAELKPISELNQRCQDARVSEADRSLVQGLVAQALDLHLTARREAALAAGVVAGLEGATQRAVDAYSAAILYGDERFVHTKEPKDVAAWDAQRAEIIAGARSLVVRDVAQGSEPPTDRELFQRQESLARLTSVSDAKLALAEGVSAAKGTALLEPESATRTAKIRELEVVEARLCRDALKELGVTSTQLAVTNDQVTSLSDSDRKVAFEAYTRLLRDSFERHDDLLRVNIEGSLKKLIDAELVPSVRSAREIDALTAYATFTLERPELLRSGSALLEGIVVAKPDNRRQALVDYLSEKSKEIGEVRSALREKVAVLAPNSAERAGIARELGDIERQFARCVTALQRGLAYDVVHAPSSEEKVAKFSALRKLLEPIQEDDLRELRETRKERDRLRAALERIDADPAKLREASAAMVRGNLQIVEASIARLSDSIVWATVYEAKIALESRDPQLSREARAIIDAIPTEVQLEPAAQRLVQAFRRDHESTQTLLALAKQFLYESVRDNPNYTYALMIALGLLGSVGAYAGRRSPHLGFLLASSATLAATKAFCVTTGLDAMASAYATGLTFSTPGSAALDLFYLANDVAQAALLYGAYKALQRSEERGLKISWPTDRRELMKTLRHEVAEYAKAGLSQLNPRHLGFYLIGIPLAVGAYQIRTSGVRPEEQLVQALNFAREVVPVLLVAILHDRIIARLQSDEARDASDGTPSVPV